MCPGSAEFRNPFFGPADLANPTRAGAVLLNAIEESKRLLCDLGHDRTPSNRRQFPPLKERFPQLYNAFAAMEILWRAAGISEKVPPFSHKGLSLPEEAFDARLVKIYARAEDEYEHAGPGGEGNLSDTNLYQYSRSLGPMESNWLPETDAAWNHLEALGRLVQDQIESRSNRKRADS